MMGRIRFFRENGWGFIQPDGRGSDLFFHVSKVMAGRRLAEEKRALHVRSGGKYAMWQTPGHKGSS